jgi:uncharacterized RDD family membrane protein YckC
MGIENNTNIMSAAPSAVGDSHELVYVGFWRRLAAYGIDFAILLPYGLLNKQLLHTSRVAYLVSMVIGILIGIVFEVYLVKRFGGSPGKLIMRMRIAKLDGSPVGYRQASIRYSVLFLINVLMTTGWLMGLFSMTDLEYAAFASSRVPVRTLELLAPSWYQPLQTAGGIWVWGEFLVLLTNKKRRALHDFLAATVVVRTVRFPWQLDQPNPAGAVRGKT